MDELEFRRRVYADPDTIDPDVVRAAELDPEKRKFIEQMRQMNHGLKQAARVSVPDDLAHKLIWQQTAEDFSRRKRKQRWYIGVAASVALTMGILGTLWFTATPSQLEYHALAHVTHVPKELPHSAQPVNLNQVNAKLASFGGQLTAAIGNIKVVNFCHLQATRSLHLILDTPQGKMSVFIVPPDKAAEIPARFGNQQYDGTSFGLQQASVMVVGAKGTNLDELAGKVRQSIRFSA